MKLIASVCDHCGEAHDLKLCEYKNIGLELCSKCEGGLLEYFSKFGKVRSMSATVHMDSGGMKSL